MDYKPWPYTWHPPRGLRVFEGYGGHVWVYDPQTTQASWYLRTGEPLGESFLSIDMFDCEYVFNESMSVPEGL